MTIRPGDERIRTSTRDRERAIEVLKAGFAEGRLTKEEFDERVALAFVSRTFADLGALTDDLPRAPLVPAPARPARPVRPQVSPRPTQAAAVALAVLVLAWVAVLLLMALAFS
jgi:hypothetical protein